MYEATKRRSHRGPLARLCDKWLKSPYSVMFLEGSPTDYVDRKQFKHVGEANSWIDHGVEPRRLHAVNRIPAIAAQLKRQKRLRGINTYGCPIDKAAKRVHGVDVINLDFCAYISVSVLQTVSAAVDAAIVNRGVVAVAVMKGREPFWRRLRVTPTDTRRARVILKTIADAGFEIVTHEVHEYVSGNVPMFWLAAKVRRV